MTASELIKKAKIIRRLLGEVEDYYCRFQQPMPVKIASSKYSRALSKLGGFHETVQELEYDGSLIVERLRSGKKQLYPPVAVQVKASFPKRLAQEA